jgi:hypothetical protein
VNIRALRLVPGLALISVTAFLVSPPAIAAEDGQVTTFVVEGRFSDLTLTFESMTPVADIESDLAPMIEPGTTAEHGDEARAEGNTESTAPIEAPSDHGAANTADARQVVLANPEGATIRCDSYYQFPDENGVYTIQRACRSQSAPWGYRLSAYVQSIVVGNVHELGMDWWREGVKQPRNAPHTVGPSYIFHGTYTPVAQGIDIRYNDVFQFRHNVGPGGEGSVSTWGSLHFGS